MNDKGNVVSLRDYLDQREADHNEAWREQCDRVSEQIVIAVTAALEGMPSDQASATLRRALTRIAGVSASNPHVFEPFGWVAGALMVWCAERDHGWNEGESCVDPWIHYYIARKPHRRKC